MQKLYFQNRKISDWNTRNSIIPFKFSPLTTINEPLIRWNCIKPTACTQKIFKKLKILDESAKAKYLQVTTRNRLNAVQIEQAHDESRQLMRITTKIEAYYCDQSCASLISRNQCQSSDLCWVFMSRSNFVIITQFN